MRRLLRRPSQFRRNDSARCNNLVAQRLHLLRLTAGKIMDDHPLAWSKLQGPVQNGSGDPRPVRLDGVAALPGLAARGRREQRKSSGRLGTSLRSL